MGGDQKGPSIFLIFKYVNKSDELIPKMVSKVVYGFFIKSYEHFKVSKFNKWRPRTHKENGSKNLLSENASEPPGKLLKFP